MRGRKSTSLPSGLDHRPDSSRSLKRPQSDTDDVPTAKRLRSDSPPQVLEPRSIIVGRPIQFAATSMIGQPQITFAALKKSST